MKILHVISDTNIGGAGVLLFNLLRHSDREKFDIAVVLPEGAALRERVKSLGFRTIEIKNGADRSFDRAAVPEIVTILNAEKPDILHTHASLSARIAGRKCHVPLIFMTHHCAVIPPKYKTKFPMKNILGMINNHYSDHIVATATAARDILVSMGTKPERISVIINGSDPLRNVSEKEKQSLKNELGISDGDFVVTMVARLEPVKNHRTFIIAAAEALSVHPEMKFIVVGDGSLLESLKALVKERGIEESVIFTGFKEDTAPYLAISDVNVNCSFSETSCLAISEGMSMGLPTIASDCEGNKAMINDGENGLLFESENSEMLATAMLTLSENAELRLTMGEKSRVRFEKCFTSEHMTRQLEALYEKEYEKKVRK